MALRERERSILEYLKKHGSASVDELCRELFVSEPTMRRDLSALNTAGKIIRTHGGAAYRSEPGQNLPQSVREREHYDAKAAIGKKCLSLIRDGDTIMVDASSTAAALLRALEGNKKSVVVVTNNAEAPMLLSQSGIKLFVTGGELAFNTHAYVGSHAEDFMRSFHADICFFSVRRLTSGGELTDNALAENAVRNIMLSRSRRRVLMLGSQKIGEACMHTLCTLDGVDAVVCEKDISAEFPSFKGKFI